MPTSHALRSRVLHKHVLQKHCLPPTLVLALGAAAAAPAVLPTLRLAAPPLLRVAGAAVTVAGLAVTVAGSRQFARAETNIVTFDDPDVLVDTGLFARTRNPMYLGFTVALVGWAAVTATWLSPLTPLAFAVAADRWYIPFEEGRMAATFGARWHDYRARVPRWLGPTA